MVLRGDNVRPLSHWSSFGSGLGGGWATTRSGGEAAKASWQPLLVLQEGREPSGCSRVAVFRTLKLLGLQRGSLGPYRGLEGLPPRSQVDGPPTTKVAKGNPDSWHSSDSRAKLSSCKLYGKASGGHVSSPFKPVTLAEKSCDISSHSGRFSPEP